MLSALFVEVISFESELPGVMVVTCTRDRSKPSSTQSLQVMNSARTDGGGGRQTPEKQEAGVVPCRASSGVNKNVGTRTGTPARFLSRGDTSWSGMR